MTKQDRHEVRHPGRPERDQRFPKDDTEVGAHQPFGVIPEHSQHHRVGIESIRQDPGECVRISDRRTPTLVPHVGMVARDRIRRSPSGQRDPPKGCRMATVRTPWVLTAALMFVLAAMTGLASTGGAAAAATSASRDFDNPASHDTSQQFAVDNPQRHDTPNDPDYDSAEPDDPDGSTSSNLYDERFDLFGFPSQLTRSTATYSAGPHAGQPQVSGFNAAGAWKQTRGDAHTTVAILDTGIQWTSGGVRDKIHLNAGELPKPEHADGKPSSTYDANGNGVLDVDDYANDPRVKRAYGPKVTGFDLIKAFSNGVDSDHNGFVDDIAGWNFFDNTNDPTDRSSYFAAHNHGTARATDAAEQGNDHSGGIGVCPKCQILPIRTWDTFVSDGNDFGMGMLYATDLGAKVIEGANGSVYHSAFAEAASRYAYDHGVVQTYSGDDLNTADHNYPGNYGHAILVQGTVPDTIGLGENFSPQATKLLDTLTGTTVGTELPVRTYFRGAGTTQFGGKSSIAMEGSSGSENVAKASGAAALVISAATASHITLRPDETRELLEQTAEDVLAPNTQGIGQADLAQPGWDPHFGYGRVNLGAAVTAASQKSTIPPEAAIDSPDWFAPIAGSTLHLSGRLRSRFTSSYHYTVQWGVGQAPTSWHTLRSANASGTVTNLGTLSMAPVRAALASYHPPADPGQPTYGAVNPLADEFTVRVVVTAGKDRVVGMDRRVFANTADKTLVTGYPKRLGTGGEAPIRYADLNGDGVQELVVPTEDGTIHAYEPDGKELPGWPVHTGLQKSVSGHHHAAGFGTLLKTAPPREPPRSVDIADLDGNGTLEVVTSAGDHVYAWEPNGKLRHGWPVSENLHLCRPSLESQTLSHPKCGFIASPALGHLEGGSALDVVVPSLDGHLYAWAPSGKPLPHYPIALVDPSKSKSTRDIAASINEPAIADLNGDGKDDVVVADNEEYGADNSSGDLSGGPSQLLNQLLGNAAGGSTRVYAVNGHTGRFLSGWPIKLTGVIQDELPLVGPGQDPAVLDLAGKPTIVVSSTGGALEEFTPAGKEVRAAQQMPNPSGQSLVTTLLTKLATAGSNPLAAATATTTQLGGINLFESAAIGDVNGDGTPDLTKYELGTLGAINLLLTGQNIPYSHLIGAWSATTGQSLSAFPTITDDYQFLSSSTVVKVVPGASNQVVAGTGLGLLHAYDGRTGKDVAGFPKHTGGWLYSPAAFSDDGRVAAITREGYLFEWKTTAGKCQTQWPAWRHDQEGTGNYSRDGTPPSAPLHLRTTSLGHHRYRLRFTGPGDDDRCGTPKRYVLDVNGHRSPVDLGTPRAAGAKVSRVITLPADARTVSVRAVDNAHNTGTATEASLTTHHSSAGSGHENPSRSNEASGNLPDTGGSPLPAELGVLLLLVGLVLRRIVRVHCTPGPRS
jgi:hypothetical protein